MIRQFFILLLAGALIFISGFQTANAKKIKVLIVTGGHEFERQQFFELFDSFSTIEYTESTHPEANVLIASEEISHYDVLVFYDMYQDITQEQQAAYLKLLKQGKGMVFLHHSLASYQKWDEFLKIVGGRYHLEGELSAGEKHKASDYSHDEDMRIFIDNKRHPITSGLKDFDIHDETYFNYEVIPNVTVLLKTDHIKSTPEIAWCHHYAASKIVYLQLGHDHYAYENPSFRKFVLQSIEWANSN